MQLSDKFSYYRRAFWHFRKGGVSQVRKFQRSGYSTSRALIEYRKNRQQGLTALVDVPFEAVPVQTELNTPAGYELHYAETKPLDYTKTFPTITVAAIFDDFSWQAWDPEFNLIPVTPHSWYETLQNTHIDLLLVESAWAGNNGAWKSHLTGPNAPSMPLISLVSYCAERNIPTVFWNKEDPPHYQDFLNSARLFDHVFTTDSNKIPDYQRDLGHNNIHTLIFAAQPEIHSPVAPLAGRHDRGVAFAGSYFAHKYPERRKQMDYLLAGAQQAAQKTYNSFEIYSRFFGHEERYQFPAQYSSNVIGSVPYSQMLTAYKAHKVILNVNSVVDSPTMCARRIFEVIASGTPVVSGSSAAIRTYFEADEVYIADDEREAELQIRALLNSEELRKRVVLKAQRKIWKEHTYSHRAQAILDAVKIQAEPDEKSILARHLVSLILPTVRPDKLQNIIQNVSTQQGVDIELVLGTHGFALTKEQQKQLTEGLPGVTVKVLELPQHLTLGECLNTLIDQASGQIISKMDDDDIYGPYYLQDQINFLKLSHADVVGKHTRMMHIKSEDLYVKYQPGHEMQATTFVAGPTITGWAEIFKELGFARKTIGEDTDFLERCLDAGYKIYSTDSSNFIQVREGDATGSDHTWEIDTLEILANGVLIGQMSPPRNIYNLNQ